MKQSLLFIILLCSISHTSLAATIGNTGEGNNAGPATANYTFGSVFTTSTSITVSTIAVRVRTLAPSGRWSAGIYEVNGSDVPTNQLSSSTLPKNVLPDQWNFISISSTALTAGQRYYIYAIFQSDQLIPADDTGGVLHVKYSLPTNPFGTPDLTQPASMCIFASDTPPTPTISPTHSTTISPTQTATPTLTITLTTTPIPSVTYTASPTATVTLSATRSATPSATRTSTRTPTCTPTVTISPTATITQSRTITPDFTMTATATFTGTPTPTPTIAAWQMPKDTISAYPVPSRGDTLWFYVYSPVQSSFVIDIYNIAGEKVNSIKRSFSSEGYQRIAWPLANVAPGIYLYRTSVSSPAGSQQLETKKIVIIKQQ